MYSDDSFLAHYYPESNEISEILSQGNSTATMEYPLSNDVDSFTSTDFADLDDFKAAVQRSSQPALCFIHQDEIHQVVDWLGESDEIAVIGESESLTQWRRKRLANTSNLKLDPLTKVYRRDVLTRSLTEACKSASPYQPVSLILLDIDHFKSVNDQFGSASSNQVLEQLGNLVRTLCRSTLVARTRGGEFGIMVFANENTAKRVAEIVKKSLNANKWCVPEKISVSFGIATVFSSCGPSKILTQADEALFAAKANGRNKIVGYSEIAEVSNRSDEEHDVICMENKARVLSDRVTSFVTQRSKRIMQTLRQEANTDALTQLFNRRYLDKQLNEDFNYAATNETELCVALIDLDHFGVVNKDHGWPTGDKVLQAVADNITKMIRATDWIGRYGGEEFCLVMPGTGLDAAKTACDRLRSTIENKQFTNTTGDPIAITLSVGVVELCPGLDHSAQELVERLSQCTLDAKQRGRNQVCWSQP